MRNAFHVWLSQEVVCGGLVYKRGDLYTHLTHDERVSPKHTLAFVSALPTYNPAYQVVSDMGMVVLHDASLTSATQQFMLAVATSKWVRLYELDTNTVLKDYDRVTGLVTDYEVRRYTPSTEGG